MSCSQSPHIVQSTCAYCGVGCGIDITVQNGEASALVGTTEHPANFGKLCVKGTNLLETTDLTNRLLEPQINNQTVDWSTATNHVADKFSQIIKDHGPDSVAFYVSGQILTEDYYLANKLMKGYIGSANIDTNSRLCMSSAVAAYKRSFGEDVVPCSYEDLDSTELLLITGSCSGNCSFNNETTAAAHTFACAFAIWPDFGNFAAMASPIICTFSLSVDS